MSSRTSQSHPSQTHRPTTGNTKLTTVKSVVIPPENDVELAFGDQRVRLTNLNKVFWQKPRITKGDLLRYYSGIAPALLPHLRDRAMVMKRYPNGAAGAVFFMKR